MNTATEENPLPDIPPARPVKTYSKDRYRVMLASMQRYSSAKRTQDVHAPAQVGPLEVTQDLLARNDLNAATMGVYRSALLWYLRSEQNQSQQNQLAYQLLTGSIQKRVGQRKTLRPKVIREEDCEALIAQLASMSERSIWANRAQHWMQATLACGLRPIEWLTAAWTDIHQTAISAVTAKTKAAKPAFMQSAMEFEDPDEEDEFADEEPRYLPRSGEDIVRGTSRTIPVPRAADRIAIDAHLAAFRGSIDTSLSQEEQLTEFARYYNQCKQVVRRACDKLWAGGKVYSIYTMRSQFSANQKAAVGTPAASALMGHSSPSTPAAAYYGKASQAHSRFKGVRPMQNQAQAEQAAADVDATPSEVCDP